MKYTEELKRFLVEYERYEVTNLKPTLQELQKVLVNWEKTEYWKSDTIGTGVAIPSPVRMILTRIKDPEKVVDKILRKPELFLTGFH